MYIVIGTAWGRAQLWNAEFMQYVVKDVYTAVS